MSDDHNALLDLLGMETIEDLEELRADDVKDMVKEVSNMDDDQINKGLKTAARVLKRSQEPIPSIEFTEMATCLMATLCLAG